MNEVISRVDDDTRTTHGVDHTLELVVDGTLQATCSCWWTATPTLDGERVGVIGHYAAVNASAGVSLLEDACALLAGHGMTRAVGPMDGSTWRRYRFVVERGSEPAFFLEPDNPDDWPSHWTGAGFRPLATYTSAVNESPGTIDPRTDEAVDRLAALGVRIRTLDVSALEDELHRIFTLSLQAFADNFLYTPIGEHEFLAQYRAVMPFVRPELVLLAEKEGDMVGYMFALPDVLQAKRGLETDTVILKTLAVHPSVRGVRLGAVLLDRAQRAAHQLGFHRAIHALIHETNFSGRISERYARTFRRYALFSRQTRA
jgi:predicted N-acetyltransferase YhbS